jgi:23S rRNA (uridine2552-2'-O)-methyltransferase
MSSQHWRRNQSKDKFFNESRKLGYRSRSVFKLDEINRKYKILKKPRSILDLGSVPGGWSSYAFEKTKLKHIVANDIEPMKPIPGVHFILGDFTSEPIQEEILKVNKSKFDLILSDISNNKTGNNITDQFSFYEIAKNVLEFSKIGLTSNGVLVIKIFIGLGFEEFKEDMDQTFKNVNIFKPNASRPESKETYAIGTKIRYTQNI